MIQTRYLCGCNVTAKKQGPRFCIQHGDPIRFVEKPPPVVKPPAPKKKAPAKRKKK